MIVLRILFIVLALSFAALISSGQVNDNSIRQQILKKGIIDSLFSFGKWTKEGETETHLRYLGKVKTKHGRTFKIVSSIWFWGPSHRATSRILIFNNKNEYIGDYYLTTVSDLPTRLRNGRLIFNNTDKYCNSKLTTVINLKNGIPKQFFRKCKDQISDIYSFESN